MEGAAKGIPGIEVLPKNETVIMRGLESRGDLHAAVKCLTFGGISLDRRYRNRDQAKPWVFWSRYWSRKVGGVIEGPYQHRKDLMAMLCKRAGVRPFGFHALRHFGASILERANVPIGSIQRILGHENRSTTEIYLHSIGEAEREAMAIFEGDCHDATQEEILKQSLTR